jgi:subtilisin family serine protease
MSFANRPCARTVASSTLVAAVAAASLLSFASASAQSGAAAPPPAQPAAQNEKKVVRTADDLPRFTYTITGQASAFIDDDASIKRLASEIRRDLESTLAAYDIQDPTTLQGYLSTLQNVAMLEGRYDDALGYIHRIRALETKEAQKLMAGIVQKSLAATRGLEPAEADRAFRDALTTQLDLLPIEKVREIVMQRKMSMEITTPDLVRGQIVATLDPLVASTNGEISSDVARQMVQVAVMLRQLMPYRQAMAEVYGSYLAKNTVEERDIWAARAVTLGPTEALNPVVLAVWDSGTDVSLFPNNLWTNEREMANGKDDDGNGFVDDIHGVAFDIDASPSTSLLFPMTNLSTPLETIQKHSSGMSDMQSNIDSPAARGAREYIRSLKQDEVGAFLEDLGQWGNYMHGTHVAGIMTEGNPFARLLVGRIEFDYRNVPLHAPSVERAKSEAAAAARTVDYFRAAGVRAVNMSWGGSRQDIENALERKGVGKDATERAAMAREIFAIGRNGLEAAIKSAPDILFIAAAGNSNNDSQFSEMIPSGLSLPNLITIGAVDQAGKPTGFTTFGSNVMLYASGYQVESFVPGGAREKASGTSMAAPQVANLAGKLLAINPKLTGAELIRIITETSDPMPGNNPGRLLINPKAAVAKVRAGSR